MSAITFGDLLLGFERTIETLVDKSKSIFGGVESTLIAFKFSGRINNLSFLAFLIILNILFLYSSNILKFNNNIVEKEYYVNDYGNQVSNFNYSVYLRIREKLYNENFPPNNPDLYPGDYLIDIANNIIKNNKDINFENFQDTE